jgi:hypothetical protein
MITYADGRPVPPLGSIYYPEPLRLIAPALAELNSETAGEPAEFAANVELCVDMVMGFLRGVHDAHAAGLAVHDRYRRRGDQYALYLRSFALAGRVLSRTPWREQLGISTGDHASRLQFAAALPPSVAPLSFVNTLDRYPDADDVPAIRVLSHNWRAAVREGVRGANLVVMHVDGPSDGVAYELQLLRECGMADRTLVLTADVDASVAGFPHVLELPHGRAGLAAAIGALAGSGFRQTTAAGDLSTLPCRIIDRHVEMARRQWSDEQLAGVPYDHFVPSSLRSNTALLLRHYPAMENGWRRIEADAERSAPSRERLVSALGAATGTFCLAVVTESYVEMAMALATMGVAYRALTADHEVLTTLYGYAAECARWSVDAELAEFLTRTHRDLLGAHA